MAFWLSEIAHHLGGRLVGDDCLIQSIGSLTSAQAGDISFLSNSKSLDALKSCKASAVLIDEAHLADAPCSAVVVSNVYLHYARLTQLFRPQILQPSLTGISPLAFIADDVEMGADVIIEPFAVIKSGTKLGSRVHIHSHVTINENCRIGDDSVINANVTIYYGCTLGQRVLIHSGAVIGSDGFGFAKNGADWVKIEQLGAVVLDDDVEIGANACIDRGAIDNTHLHAGVKIDNLVHIAHNCQIGRNTAIAAQSGMAGSTQIGERCTMGGQVGIAGHLQIADDVHFTGMSLVSGSVDKAGVYSSGSRLQENSQWRKTAVRVTQLDELFKLVKQLQKQLDAIEK